MEIQLYKAQAVAQRQAAFYKSITLESIPPVGSHYNDEDGKYTVVEIFFDDTKAIVVIKKGEEIQYKIL